MAHSISPNQKLIGTMPNQQTAEAFLQTLQASGFPVETIQLQPEEPPIPNTKAQDSGGKGAIAGTVLGSLIGLIFSYGQLNAGYDLTVHPVTHVVGTVLVGSLVGAIGVGIITAMTGVNVRDDSDRGEAAALVPQILVTSQSLPTEQVQQIQTFLQQHGGQLAKSQ